MPVTFTSPTGFVVASNALLTAGHVADDTKAPFLCAIDLANGRELWSQPLPALAVKGGIAIDKHGRSVVAMENGEIVAFAKQP